MDNRCGHATKLYNIEAVMGPFMCLAPQSHPQELRLSPGSEFAESPTDNALGNLAVHRVPKPHLLCLECDTLDVSLLSKLY